MEYSTVVHKCCCGCGQEVVTPLSPIGWKLIFDGETISLYPSIGNWNFKCLSHYWITKNVIRWASQWSRDEITMGRQVDSNARENYFNEYNSSKSKHNNKNKATKSSKLQKFVDSMTLISKIKKKYRKGNNYE